MLNRYSIASLLVALVSGPLAAEEPLSLRTALARAHAQNPDLQALRERASAAGRRGEATSRLKLPRLAIEMNAQRSDNPASVFANRLNAGEFTSADFDIARLNSPEAVSALGTALLVEIPIDIGGRINLAARAQAAGLRILTESIREAEATIALQVSEAYWGAVLARKARETTGKAVAAARSREAITEARFEEGLALRSDVLRVRARRRTREADLASQTAELAVVEALLTRLMGEPGGARFDLTDSAGPTASPDPVEAWKQRAGEGRPFLLAAQGRRDAAALALELEQRSSWPELAAQARLMDDRTSFAGGGQSWAVGARLRWNFLDPARSRRVAAAQAEERAAAEDVRAARDRVGFEVEAAFSRLTAAQERLEAAEGGALEGREALRVVQERRAQGLATLTDELETEAEAFAAELEEIGAARNTVLAEAALRRAAFVSNDTGSKVQ